MLEKIKNKFKKIDSIEDENLIEYLKKFNCTNCHNHCSLNKIKCGGGEKQRKEKIEEFNKIAE